MPLVTDHVSGAQFAFTQPVKSRPLNSGTNPASSAANVGRASSAASRSGFMWPTMDRMATNGNSIFTDGKGIDLGQSKAHASGILNKTAKRGGFVIAQKFKSYETTPIPQNRRQFRRLNSDSAAR